MGIKGLCQFLGKIAPDLVAEVPLKSLSGQRLAVDASVYLYKFICMNNQLKGNWVDMFVNFIVWLRTNNIRPVFVFDGKAPPQKERTQAERRAIRSRTEQKVLEIEELMELIGEYELNDEIPKELKERIDNVINTDTAYFSRKEIQRELYSRYKRENSKCINIGPGQVKKIQELLTFMGLPWFQASGEAERSCAWLCKWGYVKGVVTTDSDVLAYGAPVFVKDVRVNTETCELIRHQDILEVLDLTHEQFRDLCIMCGTDYNKNIPGIGPAGAYKLLCEYGDLDNISRTTVDTGILYYEEGRGLFTLPSRNEPKMVFSNIKTPFRIPAIKKADIGNLTMFLLKNNSRFEAKELDYYTFQSKFVVKE